MIAVPTPFKGEHEPDLTYVEAAARSIAPVLKKGDLVIPSRPLRWVPRSRCALAGRVPGGSAFPHQDGEQADIRVAYCPERVLPGKIMVELLRNDRVIGGMTPTCSAQASALYRLFLEGSAWRPTPAPPKCVN